MNWKRVLIGVVVVVLLLAGGYFVYQQFFAPPPAEETVQTDAAGAAQDVNTTSVSSSLGIVSAEGQIIPLRNAMLSFLSGGEVEALLVMPGTAVAAGDPILKLDATDQEIALIQAQAGLATAQANVEAAQAGLQAAQTGQTAAQVGLDAANVQLALVKAEPTGAEIALQESAIALAEAAINQASAAQSVTLQGAGSAAERGAEAQLRAAEAAFLPAREALDVLNREDSPDEDALARAQRSYNAAVANVNAAQAALDEVLAGATGGQRAAAFGGVAAAQASRAAAQAQLDLLLAGSREEQITVVESQVAQAEASLAESALAVTQAEAAVAQAEAGVEQAAAAVSTAQEALDNMTLTAPFDGVVADIIPEVGEVISAGVPVVMFGDFSDWKVETTDLTELDVVSLKVGDPVEISIDAIPGEIVTGTVTDIATTSTLTRGDVTYTVTIVLDKASELPLRWGMTVFVDVDVDEG